MGARPAVFRWGAVLLLLTASFTFAMVDPSGAWPPVVAALLQGGAVVAAVSTAQVDGRLRALALIAVTLTVGSALAAAFGGRSWSGARDTLSAGLLLLVPVAVVLEFRRDLTVTVQSVTAALCVYVVLGMTYASMASAVSNISGLPYFAGKASASSSDYEYFSFITLATVGYGDFVPALGVGRALSVLEGLTGQLYLVTVVALLVSRIGWSRPAAPPAGRD